MDTNLYINWVLGALMEKIVVPTDFHSQVDAIQEMQKDDVSGLVDTLTDFAVNTADVEFAIESQNENLNNILAEWLYTINKGYNGKVPIGIDALAKEYFKERWKYSSFPVLKIAKWEKVGNMLLPTQMFFVDGGSIYAKDIDETDANLDLINYEYYLGKDFNEKNKLDKNVIFSKSNGRWFDEYPVPYLIKRGVYHNWKIVQSLKDKEIKVLDQIIPFMTLIKKGSEALATNDVKTYTDKELETVKEQYQKMLDDMQSITSSIDERNKKNPLRVTNFDEEVQHIIPELTNIFNKTLFEQAERNILAGLGFIDVVQGISDSRRESVLNPKAFIEEVNAGVEDFKQILRQLVLLIIEKNNTHIKYVNSKFDIHSSPVKGFMSDDFKSQLRLLWERGQLSNRTYCELVGELPYNTEIHRREKELKEGLEVLMYPHQTKNNEQYESPEEQERRGEDVKEEDVNGEPIPRDKVDDPEKYDVGKKAFTIELEIAPYKTITDLPKQIKATMDSDLQEVFMRVFNNAYKQYNGDETRAFRVAWSVIRQIARKGKDGQWHRKSKRVNGKLEKVRLNEAMLEKILEKEEKDAIDDALKMQELKNSQAKSELINKLLKNKE